MTTSPHAVTRHDWTLTEVTALLQQRLDLSSTKHAPPALQCQSRASFDFTVD